MASLVRACCVGFFCLLSSAGHTQPPPSFGADCSGLRSALDRLGDTGDLCVTYGLSGRKPGDGVILTGSLQKVDKNHILLDSCLSSPPDGS